MLDIAQFEHRHVADDCGFALPTQGFRSQRLDAASNIIAINT